MSNLHLKKILSAMVIICLLVPSYEVLAKSYRASYRSYKSSGHYRSYAPRSSFKSSYRKSYSPRYSGYKRSYGFKRSYRKSYSPRYSGYKKSYSFNRSYNVGRVNPRSTYVRGYYRKNGTYVHAHRRTKPNRTKFDNYSTKGNINPWTGKYGTVNPYKPSFYVPPSPRHYYPKASNDNTPPSSRNGSSNNGFGQCMFSWQRAKDGSKCGKRAVSVKKTRNTTFSE